MTEHLVYQPPKSAAFGHKPRTRNAQKAWQSTLGFLDKHTSGRIRSSEKIRFLCHGSDVATLEDLERQLGKPAAFFPAAAYSQLQEWSLDSATIPTLIDIYFSAPGFPREDGTYLWFDICHDFRWQGCADTTLGGSYLGIIFSDSGILLQPTFAFPFAWDSPSGREWLKAILADSPFRFREQYFKRAVPTKAGTSYRMLKLGKNWLSGA